MWQCAGCYSDDVYVKGFCLPHYADAAVGLRYLACLAARPMGLDSPTGRMKRLTLQLKAQRRLCSPNWDPDERVMGSLWGRRGLKGGRPKLWFGSSFLARKRTLNTLYRADFPAARTADKSNELEHHKLEEKSQ
ncbi:hypothetical protein SRHO_G00000820 [Serrasalmus rhombeus]